MFSGVTPQWRDILLHKSCQDDLIKIVGSLIEEEKTMTPQWADVLTFAKFSFQRLRVVVVGQDPYPKRGEAHGIAFSSLAEKCPVSLSRIYGAMIESKVIDSTPKSYDLSYLCRQGMCWLNTSWTTRIDDPNVHADLWDSYTNKVFELISKHAPSPLIWLLWGSSAQKKDKLICAKHTIKKWCHPVAMTNPSFKQCPHFTEIAAAHPDIVWKNAPIETRWYTDGACPNNQNAAKARASWGVVCTKGPKAGRSWGGRLPKTERIISEGKDFDARPTNIRAEGKALIAALQEVLACGLPGKHVVCSDSKFWIDDMLLNHIPKWIKEEVPFTKKKNSDICTRLWGLYERARAVGLEFRFVNAWHDYKPNDATRQDWEGNKLAEEAAQSHLTDIKE